MEEIRRERDVGDARDADRLAVVERLEPASSSRFSRIRSPIRQISLPRSDAVIRRHGPVSNARRAARTARSMSSASPRAISASLSSVAGLTVSNVLPDAASTHSPSISSRFGLCREIRDAPL